MENAIVADGLSSQLNPANDPDLAEDYWRGGSEYGGRQAQPLDYNQVQAIVQREIEDALGGLGSLVSEQRRIALRMYYGRPMGNEIKDRSTVQTLDVLEVVEWTMPSLMRMFLGGTKVFQFNPTRPEDQHDADMATAYINYIFKEKLPGFQISYDWMKTALLEKNGIIKVYFEEKRRPKLSSYTGVTEDELAMLLNEPNVEPLSVTEDFNEALGIKTFDVSLKQWEVTKGPMIDGVAPEEFLIARRAIKLDDECPFSAQRKKMTISQLVDIGFNYEDISDLPSDDSPEYSVGRTERLSEDETFPVSTADRADAASRDVWVTDCYLRIDEDGDGHAELRRIMIVGENAVRVLEDEELESNPFVSITPVPMAYKFFGNSLADLVTDLQTIRSTILRQMLDHTYLSVNPRLAITEGMVNLDDLITVRPGGLVRQRAPGSIEPLQIPPLPPAAMQLLEHLEQVRANRTGIMAHGNELDASAINSTATGLAQLMAEKQQKIELIARIFAEGFKELGKKMLQLVVANDTKEHQLQINGEWMKFTPSTWNTDMGCSVEVGLGAGQAIERVTNLERIAQLQGQVVSQGGLNYLVHPEHIYNMASKMSEASGYANPDIFFANPAGQEPPEPPPDPEALKLQFEQQKYQADLQLKMKELDLAVQKESGLQTHRLRDLERSERVEMARIESQERIGLGQQEATIEAAEINADAREEEGGTEDE